MPEYEVGRPSERTILNILRAKTFEFYWAGSSWHVKLWTYQFRWMPEISDQIVGWWDLCPLVKVRYQRWYWLHFGMARITKLKTGEE